MVKNLERAELLIIGAILVIILLMLTSGYNKTSVRQQLIFDMTGKKVSRFEALEYPDTFFINGSIQIKGVKKK